VTARLPIPLSVSRAATLATGCLYSYAVFRSNFCVFYFWFSTLRKFFFLLLPFLHRFCILFAARKNLSIHLFCDAELHVRASEAHSDSHDYSSRQKFLLLPLLIQLQEKAVVPLRNKAQRVSPAVRQVFQRVGAVLATYAPETEDDDRETPPRSRLRKLQLPEVHQTQFDKTDIRQP